MTDLSSPTRKTTLDKDLNKLEQIEVATNVLSRGLVPIGLGLLFLAFAALVASIYVGGEAGGLVIVVAAAIGAYMAMNIGANDVANNVAPAVGAKALTLGGALVILGTVLIIRSAGGGAIQYLVARGVPADARALFETAGALIAGGDVVDTISKGIVSPAAIADPATFVRVMMAALLSSAIWVNVATWIGAPVSTTHSVVGGVVGAGIAAAGLSAVDWGVMAGIAASWAVSPLIGAVVAAAFLAFIKSFIIYQDEKIAAARRWVPLLIAIMAGAFAAYLATKGLGKITEIGGGTAMLIGGATFAIFWGLSHAHIARQSEGMENRNQSLRKLFTLPLIGSAALLSFAHGANDVANAVGPLAAIVYTVEARDVAGEVAIPFWVMIIGALGISIGLLLFGPKLIRMVGQQITRLNPMRAFCVALSAAITVIIASGLGLPVSSTHTAVGAVFGVGFFREWYTANSKRRREYLERKGVRLRNERASRIDTSDEDEFDELDLEAERSGVSREEIARRKLVRRAHVTTIVAAWVTTVPAAALLSAVIFFMLDAIA